MSYGLQCFDSSGLLTFDTNLPVFKLISKTTHTIPPSGLMRDLTLAAPGALNSSIIKIATVYSMPLSERVYAGYDHEAFLRSINTNSVSYRFYNGVTATLTIYVFKL